MVCSALYLRFNQVVSEVLGELLITFLLQEENLFMFQALNFYEYLFMFQALKFLFSVSYLFPVSWMEDHFLMDDFICKGS